MKLEKPFAPSRQMDLIFFAWKKMLNEILPSLKCTITEEMSNFFFETNITGLCMY